MPPIDPAKVNQHETHPLQARFDSAIRRMSEIAATLPEKQREQLLLQIRLADLSHAGLVPQPVVS